MSATTIYRQMFGAPIRRKEDPRLLTGGGRYLDDKTGDPNAYRRGCCACYHDYHYARAGN